MIDGNGIRPVSIVHVGYGICPQRLFLEPYWWKNKTEMPIIAALHAAEHAALP